MKDLIFVGDIGGTNSRFSLYDSEDETKSLVYKEYSTQGSADPGLAYGGFLRMLDKALVECLATQDITKDQEGLRIVCCFACAGPVKKNVCKFTNVADGLFEVNGEAICEAFESLIPVAKVVNDFVGMGYGVLTVDVTNDEECKELNKGDGIDPVGPIACVGAGTGLGECYLTTTTDRSGYVCFPSEGGHSDYVPRSDLDMEMLMYIRKKFSKHSSSIDNRASVERVCSGSGLPNIYEFLAKKFPRRVDKKVHEEINNAKDMKGKVIAMNATPGSLCEQVMECFATTYGAEVGSCAAKFIPTGGIFLTGGLTPKNMDYIQGTNSPFMKAFLERGRLSSMMESIPLYAVIPEDLGVRGAFYIAKRVCHILKFRSFPFMSFNVSCI